MKTELTKYHRKLRVPFLSSLLVVMLVVNFSQNVFSQITWYEQTTGTTDTIQDMHFVSDQLGWAVGNNGVLLHTSDGGLSWINQNTAGFTDDFQEVFFFNSSRGAIIGEGGNVFVTLNGGAVWNAAGSTGIPFLESVYFVDLSTGWACGSDGTQGLLYKTTNGGLVWFQVTGIGTPGPLLKLEFVDTEEGWVVGETGVFHTTDATNWFPQSVPTSQVLNSISMVDPFKGWIVGDDGTILNTTDGGNNWFFQSSFTTNNLLDVEFFDYNNGVTVGLNGTVLYTIDGGLNWSGSPGFLNTISFNTVEMVTPGTVLVGGSGGKIFKSPDVENDLEILYYLGFDTLCANIPTDVHVTIINNGPGIIETANILIMKGSDVVVNYIWNGLLVAGQTADVNLGSATVDQSGTYNGIIYGDSVLINNISDHDIEVISKPGSTSGLHTICPGDSVEIEAFGGSTYFWSNAGLDYANPKQTVIPALSQDYYVLIQTEYCLAPDTVQVIIDPCTDPVSAISPNGDGINDFLIIDGIADAENTVKIYNRWGDLVNSFTNYNNETTFFDGTDSNGENLGVGTFFYSYECPSLGISGSSWVQIVLNY